MNQQIKIRKTTSTANKFIQSKNNKTKPPNQAMSKRFKLQATSY
jgi:hypothetical protein